MSAIFGIFNTDQSPIPEQLPNAMQRALDHWGPDEQKRLIRHNICFGQHMLANTPEAQYEDLPCQTESGLLFTAEARLDNREELCTQFGIPRAERAQVPDGALILRAYEKWGDACPDHLLGDWSFAIFDPAAQKLFLARDHLGNTALYYHQAANRFAFASSRRALLAIGAPRRLNELYLAQMLIAWPAYHGPQTIDCDIFRLPPSHAMTVTPQATRVWQYWHLENTPELRLPSFEEYVEGLLEVYREAVRCRLRSSRPIAVTLSGGLDSGSVTALAGAELRAQGQRLLAFTSVPQYDVSDTVGPNRFGDELALARATAAHCGNVDHYVVTGEDITPVEGVRQMVALTEEPGYAASNFYWILDLFRMAQIHGVGALLTGQGGNGTVSWVGKPEFRSPRLMLKRYGWREAVKKQLPIPLLRAVQQWRSRRMDFNHTAIHPDFARRLNLAWQRAAAIGRDLSLPDGARNVREWRQGLIQPASNIVGALWAEVGAAHNMDVRDPTLDRRVMTYAFSIPDPVFGDGQGADRRLIRAAMTSLLPDEVRLNRRRGRQAADIAFRLQKSANEVEHVLEDLQSGPVAEYLNLRRMRQAWVDVQQDPGPHSTHRAVTILLRGISAGIFLDNVYPAPAAD